MLSRRVFLWASNGCSGKALLAPDVSNRFVPVDHCLPILINRTNSSPNHVNVPQVLLSLSSLRSSTLSNTIISSSSQKDCLLSYATNLLLFPKPLSSQAEKLQQAEELASQLAVKLLVQTAISKAVQAEEQRRAEAMNAASEQHNQQVSVKLQHVASVKEVQSEPDRQLRQQ